MPNGRERLLMNLRQELASEEFPHMFLDPLMCWHPGFNYWHNKFESLARELVVRGKIRNHLEALKAISRRVVTLEPFAYHSKNFGSHNLLTKLPSFIMAKEVIKNLAERAREREITVVVARNAKQIGVEEEAGNLVIYRSSIEAQSANIGPKSRGGRAILRAFGVDVSELT
jgi:hypothetical protein